MPPAGRVFAPGAGSGELDPRPSEQARRRRGGELERGEIRKEKRGVRGKKQKRKQKSHPTAPRGQMAFKGIMFFRD
jgi:hypothetical protein